MIDPASNDVLSQLMQELGPADPPVGLRRQVMARIAQQQATERSIPFNRRGIAMTKKAMYGIAAAAALALGVFAIYGFPPVGRGTEGTIGAAKKYQAPQMDSKDVVVGDAAAQEFLQSEVFDRIMKDPEARSLLSDAGVRAALGTRAISDALKTTDVRYALGHPDLLRLFTNRETKAALEDAYRTDATAAVRRASDSAARINARQAISRARENQALAKVLDSAALTQALLRTDLLSHLARANMVSAIQSKAFIAGLNHGGFNASLTGGRLASALAAK